MASIILDEQVRIPLGLANLDDFRRWSQSDGFPPRGRIDYIHDNIEVDMSPEDLFTHGTLKGEIYSTLLSLIKENELGHLFTDSTRVTHEKTPLSTEPDIVYVSYESLDNGRCRLVPKASGLADRYIEIEGSPDLVVEVVSDSSFHKDTERLLHAYFKAGIAEYWIVDARSEQLLFVINSPSDKQYERLTPGADGFQVSAVLNHRFRLKRNRNSRGYWQYDLEVTQ